MGGQCEVAECGRWKLKWYIQGSYSSEPVLNFVVEASHTGKLRHANGQGKAAARRHTHALRSPASPVPSDRSQISLVATSFGNVDLTNASGVAWSQVNDLPLSATTMQPLMRQPVPTRRSSR